MKMYKSLLFVLTWGLLAGSTLVVAATLVPQKAVLVTGASTGIGLSIAETLAKNGFYVYAGARKPADLQRLDALENISAVKLDVTVQQDIDAAVEFVRSQGRGLWGVVNNAGIVEVGLLSGDSDAAFRWTFEVNVFGPVRINQAFMPLLRESKGRTTIIGSISGYIVDSSDGGDGGYKSQIRNKMLEQMLAAADAGELSLDAASRAKMVSTNYGNDSLKEPDEVAAAVLDVRSSVTPRRRYMVTPNLEQAQMTISAALRRLLELNAHQPYSYNRDQLIALLDQLLAAP